MSRITFWIDYYVGHFRPKNRGSKVGQCFWCLRSMDPEERAELERSW